MSKIVYVICIPSSDLIYSLEMKKLEEELFNHCKAKESDLKANSGMLLQVYNQI